MNFYLFEQLPVLPPSTYANRSKWTGGRAIRDYIGKRAAELIWTDDATVPFAKDVGFPGIGRSWDDACRFRLRCELDAAFFHLYGVVREDAEYIMDTFPIVKRKDEKKYGEYRTKRVILEIYDEMSAESKHGF